MTEREQQPQRVGRRAFVRRSAGAGLTALGLLGLADSSSGQTPTAAGPRPVRVRVWCEGTAPRSVYPDDVDGALAWGLGRRPELSVARARLEAPAAGLSDADLDATDVLVWWGRLRHDDVPGDRASAVVRRVRAGQLGLVALHASCASRPFRALMDSSCEPGGWRQDGRPEHVAVQAPAHPITRGVASFTIPRNDMYREPFTIPTPETVLLLSTWDHGETVRSGMTWRVDRGRVVYLRAGHDAYPVLFHPTVRALVANAVEWAAGRS